MKKPKIKFTKITDGLPFEINVKITDDKVHALDERIFLIVYDGLIESAGYVGSGKFRGEVSCEIVYPWGWIEIEEET